MTKVLLLFKAEQFSLFDEEVLVEGHTRTDGTYVAPYTARRKKKHTTENSRRIKKDARGAQSSIFAKPVADAESESASAPAVVANSSGGVGYDRPFDAIDIPDFGVHAGVSKAERKRLNARAVEILNSKPDGFSDEEKAALAKYSGQGGVGDSLNEYYTRPDIAVATWSVLRNLGVSAGNVLEPSCGTGVFLATAPSGVKVTGVELDGTSSRIAGILHEGHEVAGGSLEGFATSDVRQFDAVVGNAPFGLRGGLIKDDKPDLPTAEQYFLDAAIDKTKGGGIVALIVPTGIMDGANTRAFRERVLRKAEFVGAHRMPNTAFAHAHTGVTTDLVIFRKRPQDVANALSSSSVTQDDLKSLWLWDDEFLSGGYFSGSGQENVYGRPEAGWRAKAGMGSDFTVSGAMEGVAAHIAEFVGNNPPKPIEVSDILAVADDEGKRRKIQSAALKQPYDHAEIGDTKVIGGVTYVLQGSPPRWRRADGDDSAPEAVSDADELATILDTLFDRVKDGGDVGDLRASAESALDEYVKKHGIPSRNKDLRAAAGGDKRLWRLIGAVNKDGSYSDLVTGRERKENASDFDLVAARLAETQGGFTADDLAESWTGGDREVALDHLFASTQYAVDADGKTWMSADDFLSGSLWDRYDAMKAVLAHEGIEDHYRTKYADQLKAVEEAIDPKTLDEVDFQINSAWVPVEMIAAWQNDKVRQYKEQYPARGWTPDPFEISFADGVYTLSGGLFERELLDKYLNRTGVRKENLGRIEEMNQEFRDWLLSSEFRERIEDLYNRKFRGYKQKEHSDAAITVPGLQQSGRSVNAYHWVGVRWALEQGKGIIAADVGVGKTTRALVLGKLLKAYGRAKKPAFIVPKSVLANWKAEIDDWFPGSNVLIIGEDLERGRSDTAQERDEKYHLLSQNDYDFVLISQPSFNDLDMDPIKKWEYLNNDFWEQRREALGQAGDKRREKMRVAYEQAMANREFQKRTDAIYFNDLGIDALIVDEMAAFKNLYAAKARFGDTPKFLGGQGLSNRALDLNMKARWVREQNNGLGIYGLSATPTKNSPLEIYSMLSHIAPEEFESRGIRNSEEFLDRYCKFELDNILGTDGKIKEATVTAGFKNLDELREVMQKYIDRQTAADVGLVIPKPEEHQHLVEMTERQKAVYAELREMAEKSKEEGDSTGDAHIFSIMDKMRKAAIDLELLDPKHAGERSPKYEAAADEIAKGAKDGGQVVFIDSVDSHQKLADLLEKKGIKRSEIGIINAQVASSATARQKISDAFNAGKLKVVIGNTATMGEGVNLQKGTTDIHHLDLPWDPASMQQRNGRGVRQGNINESVRIHSYIAKGSFDGYRYQTMMAKKDWMDLLWNGGNEVENLAREGAVSRDDMLVMLAANPDEARKQMEENKAAQMERIAAEGRKRAGDVFVRFQDMDRSYRSLKDHGTASAVRLKSKLEGLRSQLRADKWFAAKEALDAGKPALVQRDTGDVWHEGKAFEMDPGPDAPIYWSSAAKSRWVATGVDARKGHVMAREYGKPNGEAKAFDIEKMHRGVKSVAHDPEQEKSYVARKALTVGVDDSVSAALNMMHKRREAVIDDESKARVAKAVGDAVAKAAEAHEWTRKKYTREAMRVAIRNALDGAVPAPVGGQDFSGDDMAWAAERIYRGVLMGAEGLDPVSVRTPAHLVGVGDQVMAALHDDLQGILKDKVRSYEDHGHNGPYGMLDKAGNPVAFANYDGRKHLDDHDLMLPMAENKARAIRAYMEAEEGREVGTKYGDQGRSKRAVALGLEAKYRGFEYGADAGNPWKSIGKALWGDGFESEAREALERSSVHRMGTASSMTDAAKHAETLASIGYGGKVAWPKAALAGMWKAADRLGVLDSPLEGAVEFKTWQRKEGVTRSLFGGIEKHPIRAALTELAKESGHTDMAAAFIVKSESGFGDKVRALVGLRRVSYPSSYEGGMYVNRPPSVSYDRAVIEAIQHVAAGGLGVKVSEFREKYLPALRDDPVFSRANGEKTVGDALSEALKNA